MEQSRERSCAPLHLSVVPIEKGTFEWLSTTVANFTFICKKTNKPQKTIKTNSNNNNNKTKQNKTKKHKIQLVDFVFENCL